MKRAVQSNLDLKLAAACVAEARPETRSVNEQTKTMSPSHQWKGESECVRSLTEVLSLWS